MIRSCAMTWSPAQKPGEEDLCSVVDDPSTGQLLTVFEKQSTDQFMPSTDERSSSQDLNQIQTFVHSIIVSPGDIERVHDFGGSNASPIPNIRCNRCSHFCVFQRVQIEDMNRVSVSRDHSGNGIQRRPKPIPYFKL